MIARVRPPRPTVLFDIYVAGQLVNELVLREFERRGLKVRAEVLLAHIALRGPVTPGELEGLTGLRPSTLRERMQPLLDAQLVRRRPSSEDRRSHTLEVTDEGRAHLEETYPAAVAAQQRLEEELGHSLEEDRPAIEAIVQAAQAALAAGSAGHAPD